MYRVVITAAALALSAPAVAATYLHSDIQGTVSTSIPTPVPGQQQITINGNFLTYVASPDLPQINGGDLDQYSFSLTGLSSAYDDATRTATYSNVTGTINGYGQVVQNLAPTTLTVQFDPTFMTATVLGTLMSTGPVTPPGFPGPIDFTPANGASITALYTSNGAPGGGGRFVGSINYPSIAGVPEPATWALMIGGFGLAGAALRRRRTSVRFA